MVKLKPSRFKRRISPVQLMQLSDEQKIKLRERWYPMRGDFIYAEQWGITDIILRIEKQKLIFENDELLLKSDCLPLLDIGQLINLIHSNVLDGEMKVFYHDPSVSWVVQSYVGGGDWTSGFWSDGSHDLCDVLWLEFLRVLK